MLGGGGGGKNFIYMYFVGELHPRLYIITNCRKSVLCRDLKCPFCTAKPCGVCGNCLHPERKNKCVERYFVFFVSLQYVMPATPPPLPSFVFFTSFGDPDP